MPMSEDCEIFVKNELNMIKVEPAFKTYCKIIKLYDRNKIF